MLRISHHVIVTRSIQLITADVSTVFVFFKPEVSQSPDARLSQAFGVTGFISMISKVKMQEKIQED